MWMTWGATGPMGVPQGACISIESIDGSTIFAKSILGDCLLSDALHDAHLALYDIDRSRLRDSKMMMDNLNENINGGRATITAHHGVRSRKAALKDADYVVNAIQVGGYEPSTVRNVVTASRSRSAAWVVSRSTFPSKST